MVRIPTPGKLRRLTVTIVLLAIAVLAGAASGQARSLLSTNVVVPNAVKRSCFAKPATGAEDEVTLQQERLIAGKPWLAVANVTRPTMTIYPPTGPNTGAAVVVIAYLEAPGSVRVLTVEAGQ